MYFAAFKISELRSRYFSVRSVISRPKSRPSGRLASKRTCGCSPRFPLRISLRNLLRGPLKSAGKKQSGGLFLRPRVPGLGARYRGPSNLLCNLSRGPLVRVPPWWLTFWFALCVLGFGSQGLSANQYVTGILFLTPSSGSKRKKGGESPLSDDAPPLLYSYSQQNFRKFSGSSDSLASRRRGCG